LLKFKEDHGFYICSICGAELWPGPKDYGNKGIWQQEQEYKKTISKHGSSGNKAKSRYKKKYIKNLPSERNKL
jgi:hypothetical protein